MTIVVKGKSHIHKFTKEVTQKVLLSSGLKQGLDILKQRACTCGAVQTYDLERRV